MRRYERIEDLRQALRAERQDQRTVGLVPTMGALHAGHEALMANARKDNEIVVVSIFVNPAQFGDADDFDQYPRTLAKDLTVCAERGVDMVFCPAVNEIYPEPLQTHVAVEPLGDDLIGSVRPGHFRGVATVVTKLLNIVQPDRAYFGQKDFQQLAIIRRMVRDLSSPVEIVGVPTVREADGLAMSSRNTRLTSGEREAAKVISRALKSGAASIESGETSVDGTIDRMRRIIATEPLADLRSLDIRSSRFLEPVEAIGPEPVVILVTARFGSVLLIDQWEAVPPKKRTEKEGEQ